MTITLERIQTQDILPKNTEVVIIGGGIIGISAALTLAERNIPVVLIEKGHIAGEQSSRNLGWIRKTNRHADDIPLAQEAEKLWQNMSKRVGNNVGYEQAGIMFVADSEQQLSTHENWLKSVQGLNLDSHLLNGKQVTEITKGKGKWKGAIYTPSDGRAEPSIAVPAMAKAAIKKGVIILQNTAVRTLSFSGGKISGVITEQGEIKCNQVLLSGGAWSRRFLANHKVSLFSLPLICSVLRTKPIKGPTEIAVGADNFSFRKHKDGGFIITQRGALDAPIELDHLMIGYRYLEQLKNQRQFLRVKLGKHFIDDLRLSRRWNSSQISPFEKIRTISPSHNQTLLNEAMRNLCNAWPEFKQAQIEESWAGVIDVTPDSNPVIDHIEALPGLTLASGFSGHGFGTGPAAGHLAADLISGQPPIVNPAPYRFNRL